MTRLRFPEDVRSALCIALLAACSYQHGVLADDGDDDGTSPADADGAADDAGDQPTIDAAPDAAPDARTCPNDFVAIDGGQPTSRYKFYGYAQSTSNVVDFNQATSACTAAGGYIAIPNNEAEIGALDDVSQNPNQPGYWVGITDTAVEGQWRTVLGDLATYLRWSSSQGGQPNGGAAANCLVAYNEELYDVDCAMAAYVFVCECAL